MKQLLIVAALMLPLGCSGQAIKQDITKLEADTHTAATFVAGAAMALLTAAKDNPDAAAELKTLSLRLAGSAGVTPEEQSVLAGEITTQNLAKIVSTAAQIAARTIPAGTAPIGSGQ